MLKTRVSSNHIIKVILSLAQTINHYNNFNSGMSKSGLGKAIKNKLERKYRSKIGDKAPIFYQETEENEAELKKQKMKSVVEQSSLN